MTEPAPKREWLRSVVTTLAVLTICWLGYQLYLTSVWAAADIVVHDASYVVIDLDWPLVVVGMLLLTIAAAVGWRLLRKQ